MSKYNKNIELIINGQLITGLENVNINLTRTVKDIMSPETVKGTYSYDFLIPSNPNNDNIFDNIFEINSLTSFKPFGNNITELRVNGSSIFTGKLQLNNIETQYIGTQQINYYNCILFGSTKSLFIDIENKYMKDLDLSKYDHTSTFANVSSSWTAGSGSYYPIIDYGQGLDEAYLYAYGYYGGLALEDKPFKPYDLKPAVYIKTAWDQIFKEAGYRYTSSAAFMDEFSKIVYPYANPNPCQTNLLVSASVSYPGYKFDGMIGSNLPMGSFVTDVINPQTIWPNSMYKNLSFAGTKGGSYYYNGIGTFFIAPETGDYTFDIRNFWFVNGGANYFNVYVAELPDADEDNKVAVSDLWTFIGPTLLHDIRLVATCKKGGKYKIECELQQGGWFGEIKLCELSISAENVAPGLPASKDDTVHLANSFDPDLKQTEFLRAINKLYNLYWEQDSIDPTLIHIDPYTQFFQINPVVHNWNDKLDENNGLLTEYKEQPSQKYNFRYEEGEDTYNVDYDATHPVSYGALMVDYTSSYYNTADIIEIKPDKFQPSVLGYAGTGPGLINYIAKYAPPTPPTSSFAPTDIAGCKLWLDAGVGVTETGGAVSAWADQSGNNRYAYQNTGAQQPNVVSNVLNGKPVIRVSSAIPNQFMWLNGGAFYTACTMFYVYKKLSVSSFMKLLGSTGAAPVTSTTLLGTVDYGNDSFYLSVGSYKYLVDLATNPNNYSSFVTMTTTSTGSGASVKMYRNNLSTPTSVAVPGTGSFYLDGLFLSGYVGGTYPSGDLAEVIFYDNVISDTDRGLVEAYLKTKYNHY